MAARDFRLFSDILPAIRALVDQPKDDPSQIGFPLSDLVNGASFAVEQLHFLASQLESNWCTKEAFITTVPNQNWLPAPDDCRGVRSTSEWNVAGDRKVRPITVGVWGNVGERGLYETLFKPKDNDHDNQATLRFTTAPTRTYTIKVIYEYFPLRLIHGCLPENAGATSLRLADYEPRESAIHVDQRLYIVEDPNGAAGAKAYGDELITAWDGQTQTATTAAWSPIPKVGATYTSRPDLPREWERLFVLETGVHAGLKMPKRLISEWEQLRQQQEVRDKHRAATVERRAAKLVGGGRRGRRGRGDPINGVHAGYSPPLDS